MSLGHIPSVVPHTCFAVAGSASLGRRQAASGSGWLPFGVCWFPLAVCGCQNRGAVGLQEPFQHESLLIDRKEHKLTKAEKKAAKKSYEEEKRASVPYTRPSYAQYYPASDQSLTSIPAFSQRNW